MKNELRAWYKTHGICVCCGQQDAAKGQTRCIQCKFKYNESAAVYHAKHRERLNAVCKERNKTSYEHRKKAGMCVRCGKRQSAPGRVRCGLCLAKDRNAHMKRERANGTIPRYMFGNGDYCQTCGKPSEGVKLCMKCLSNSRRTIVEARKHIKSGWQYENFIFGRLENDK